MIFLSKWLDQKGVIFYQSDKFNLDNSYYDSFQDDGEYFQSVFETDYKEGDIITLQGTIPSSLFKYFLDGSRKTYKIGDMVSTDGKFLPIVAGQIGVGVCSRHDKTLKIHSLTRSNVISIYKNIEADDLLDIKRHIEKEKIYGIPFEMLIYGIPNNQERIERIENSAIASIQIRMQNMELRMLNELVQKNMLKTNEMLILDGSLQFMQSKLNGKVIDPRLFMNVIGLSKSFNPNLRKVLKSKNKEIGSFLPKLKFGQRTPVFKYTDIKSSRIIGAWYLRIRDEKQVKNSLDGIVKLEKIALGNEIEFGFDSGLIDNISKSILVERNVTCFGLDKRWANHIYPIFLTERFLKNSFLSDIHFLKLFS